MANNNNIDGTLWITTNNTQLLGNGYTLPSDFNNSRQPGELASLFNANSNVIYNKFSAKTGHVNSLLKFGPRQPFIVSTPNKHSTLFSTRAFPLGSALIDLQRISKWQVSGTGVIFIAKQLLMQGQNAFNETKIYNPAMPILAVASRASFGLISTPTRHLDLSGGFGSLLGFGSNDRPVSTTVASGNAGKSSLSDRAKTASNPYKGLLRGVTASDAFDAANKKWQSQKNGSLFGNYFKSGFNKIFGGLIPVGQPTNTYYRADEGMYGIMLGAKDKFQSSLTSNDNELKWGANFYQRWEGGSNTKGPSQSIKKSKQTSIADNKKLVTVFNGTIPQTSQYFGVDVGYTIANNSEGYKTYRDNVGIVRIKKKQAGTDSYEYSDILSVYKVYTSIEGTVEKNTKVVSDSKFNDKNADAVQLINKTLQKTIDNIKSAGYSYVPADDADKIMQQFSNNSYIGMDNVTYKTKDPFSDNKGISPNNYNGGYMTQFSFEKRKQLLDDHEKGKGFPTTNQADKINLLGVLDSNEFGPDAGKYMTYDPNTDDLIAFYFHDLVNDRYLPFRAVFKGISESATAEWNDVSYLGRADKLYTYKGFTRSISFNFTVNISSIKEFAPTWQKINYFVSLIKPANYTAKNNADLLTFSRFIIPPMVKFTIGDLYVDQPGLITSIGFSVPDDAAWETLNEVYASSNDWTYLNNVIQWKKSTDKYAQLPRTVDFSVSMNLLEKEKPIVGGSHFGSAYHTDPYYQTVTSHATFSSDLLVK